MWRKKILANFVTPYDLWQTNGNYIVRALDVACDRLFNQLTVGAIIVIVVILCWLLTHLVHRCRCLVAMQLFSVRLWRNPSCNRDRVCIFIKGFYFVFASTLSISLFVCTGVPSLPVPFRLVDAFNRPEERRISTRSNNKARKYEENKEWQCSVKHLREHIALRRLLSVIARERWMHMHTQNHSNYLWHNSGKVRSVSSAGARRRTWQRMQWVQIDRQQKWRFLFVSMCARCCSLKLYWNVKSNSTRNIISIEASRLLLLVVSLNVCRCEAPTQWFGFVCDGIAAGPTGNGYYCIGKLLDR